MKKVVLSILALVYFFAVTGWEINIHYCMGRVDNVSLLTIEKDTCSTCDMSGADKQGCCHDENQFVRLAQDQKQPNYYQYQLVVPESAVLSNQLNDTISPGISILQAENIIELDLPPPSTPLFIRNQVFRI